MARSLCCSYRPNRELATVGPRSSSDEDDVILNTCQDNNQAGTDARSRDWMASVSAVVTAARELILLSTCGIRKCKVYRRQLQSATIRDGKRQECSDGKRMKKSKSTVCQRFSATNLARCHDAGDSAAHTALD